MSGIKLLRPNPTENTESGIYICTSDNGRSKDVKQVNLNIIAKPLIDTHNYRSFQSIKIKTRFNQNCPIKNMDSNTEVTWWKVCWKQK